MAIYKHNGADSRNRGNLPRKAGDATIIRGSFTIAQENEFNANDVHEFIRLPRDLRLQELTVDIPSMSTGRYSVGIIRGSAGSTTSRSFGAGNTGRGAAALKETRHFDSYIDEYEDANAPTTKYAVGIFVTTTDADLGEDKEVFWSAVVAAVLD